MATRIFRCRNIAADPPRRYLMDPMDLHRALVAMGEADETDATGNVGEPLAIYHSHVESFARPSPTDIGEAERWPYSYYVVASLRYEPVLAAFRIEGGTVTPVELRP